MIQCNKKGGVEEEKRQRDKKDLGGLRTIPFILAIEACEKFSVFGLYPKMSNYLTEELHLESRRASNIVAISFAISSFAPLVGNAIADSYAGRYRTIVVASIAHLKGMVILTISAALPSSQFTSKLWLYYSYVLLTSIGSGGIRPCVVTFAADQIDMNKSSVNSRRWNFFDWYTICMAVARIVLSVFWMFIQDHISWSWGFSIPTTAMALSVAAFLLGSRHYRIIEATGSHWVRILQVTIAALKKIKEVTPHSSLLYKNGKLDANLFATGRLLHSNQFKWLDKAAIVRESDETGGKTANLWRIATVHRVEEIKCIIRVLPIWLAGIIFAASESTIPFFVFRQADLSHFHIQISTFSFLSVVTTILGLLLYQRYFIPLARRFTGNPTGITCLQRLGIGYFINIILFISAVPESKIKSAVFYLFTQFLIDGISSVFTSSTVLEFLYEQLSGSMASVSVTLSTVRVSIGYYLALILVYEVQKHSKWLNGSKLYCLLLGILGFGMIYYLLCAWLYSNKIVEEIKEEEIVDPEAGLEVR